MKLFRYITIATAILSASCSQFQDADGNAVISATHPRYYASLDEETKTYVEDNKYLRWHAEDEISVFPTHTTNVRYQFEGQTGDKGGSFKMLEADVATGNPLNYTYAVYPYNSANSISDDGVLLVTLPMVQHYAERSFGRGANTSVAVSENAVSDKLFFKNACGYLKLRLYGEAQEIKSVTLRGNNGEKIAGAATITATFDGVPEVKMSDSATTDVVIVCDGGVMLGTTAEEATEFWFVLPEVVFTKGFTVYVSGEVREMKQSTSNSVTIERNKILPMEALQVEPNITIANRKILYTSSDGNIVTPYSGSVFGAKIISNTYENGQGVIEFDGEITRVGTRAFQNCKTLTSITIPDSVTSIGSSAFSSCSSLTSVTIPDNVTSIGSSAFSSCSSLASVVIPDGITEIKEDTFKKCTSLKSVTIPASVTAIGEYAFYGCTGLSEVHITDIASWCEIKYSSVKYGKTPLYYAKNLYLNGALVEGNLVIPDGVISIGDHAFYGCAAIASVTIPDSVTSIGYETFYNCDGLTSVTIPNSVTSIGAYAFYGCELLKSVTLPESIQSMGDYVFKSCTSMTSATIGTPKLGNYAFSYCENLKNITFTDTVTSIGNSAFYNCTSIENVTIPGNIVSIGTSAFRNCAQLSKITIEESIAKIEDSTFSGCTSLTSITIPDSVTSIGTFAFQNCTSLTSITIPDSVTSIDNEAFSSCSSLASVTIGKGVTSIGGLAFYQCTSLARVDISDLSAWCKISFDGTYTNPLTNGAELYINGIKATKIAIPADITKVKQYAFCGCTSLTDVNIHDNVTSIESGAFENCTSLAKVTLPDGITTIESATFYNCTSLMGITIPDSVTKIKENAFYKCSSLDGEIIIPEGVTSIGEKAFNGCSGIDKVVIPSTVTGFGLYTFSGCNCEAVIKCNIPNKIKIYGNSFSGVFSGNTFHKVTITEGVTTIGSKAFYDNDVLISLTLPETLTAIKEEAFYNCQALRSVTIPKNVTEIGIRAFNYCTELFAVICEPTTPPTLGSYAFTSAKSSLTIRVPSRAVYMADPEWAKYDVCLVEDVFLVD